MKEQKVVKIEVKNIITYEDDITKQFMQNVPNDYNGLVKNNKGDLISEPSLEIEHLLLRNKQFNAKANQIKDYIKSHEINK